MENDDSKSSIAEVQDRIFQIISTMPEAQKRKLLTSLERWQFKFEEKRKYPRKQTLIWVECSCDRSTLHDFIQNISVSGLFIETLVPFNVGEEFLMTFSLPGAEDRIKITGKIVRLDVRGIAVQFDELLHDI